MSILRRTTLKLPRPGSTFIQSRTCTRLAGLPTTRSATQTSNSLCTGTCLSKRCAATAASSFANSSIPALPTVSRVSIPLGHSHQDFSAILLRDMCECPLCVHESSKQRLFSTSEIPAAIQPRSVAESTTARDAVDIFWKHDAPGFDENHKTTISLDVLRGLKAVGEAPGPFQTPPASSIAWDAKSATLPDYDYDSYMNDDATLYQAVKQLHSHGLAFIVGAPGIEKSVSTIAERIGPVKDTFYGYTWDVRTVPQAINAAYTSAGLDFHTDLLYFKDPPHIQLLHCIQSSSSGGASVFADAFKAAADLYESDREAFDILSTFSVNYHYKHVDSNLYTATKPVFDIRPLNVGGQTYKTVTEFLEAWESKRQQVLRTTGTEVPALGVVDVLEKINWGPPFMAPFSLSQESLEQARSLLPAHESLNAKVDTWHAAAQKFSALLNRPGVLHERLMQPGTCVLFNNTRVLHSRRAFSADDAGKPRWLRGTYVDRDPFLSKFRVLRRKFESSGPASKAK